jgi:hypothetical protein
MSLNSYDAQILSIVAAGAIQFDGTTPIAYGCSMTRTATGIYKLILPTGEGLIDEQSFTIVTNKGPGQSVLVVSDESIYIKTVHSYANTGGADTDTTIEMYVLRSTINPF